MADMENTNALIKQLLELGQWDEAIRVAKEAYPDPAVQQRLIETIEAARQRHESTSAANPNMIYCKYCGKTISKTAKSCPHCGGRFKKPVYKRWWFIVIVVIVVLGILGNLGGNEDSTPADDLPSSGHATVRPDGSVDGNSFEIDGGWTINQKNVMKRAKDYLSLMAFSYTGLIEQLEYEQFSHEDAVWAADNCNADWSEQALIKAKDYLDNMAFSYTGLIDQLEYEGFTSEQATYGADNCGADWFKQAEIRAKDYLDNMAFSREGLIDQLEYEGFTTDQATHGVNATGLK